MDDAEPIRYNPEYKEYLQNNSDLDERLASHIARLFVRDPVPAYEGEFMDEQIDDNDLVAHFENI